MTENASRDARYAERNRRTGEERRRKMRTLLVDTAIAVISDRGVEAPVVDDFIAAAGISRGSFYNHFGTKEALVEAVVEHLRDQMRRSNEVLLSRIDDPAERLVWGAHHVIRHAGSDPQLGLLLISATGRITPFDTMLRRGPSEDVRACVAQGLLPDQDVDVAVDFLIGAIREAARAVISLSRAADHAQGTAFLILRGLGMDPDLARDLAYRRLHARIAGEAG